jgi:hypothetical protein
VEALAAPDRCVGLHNQRAMKEYNVHIVVDDNFGDKLREFPFREPVWVVESPSNKIVIEELWKTRVNEDHTEGITSFIYHNKETPEQRLIGILEAVIEHHGPYSHEPPCTKYQN